MTPKQANGDGVWGNDQPVEWFKGDRIQATGGIVKLHGALWSQWRYLDGHRKGQECLRPITNPNPTGAGPHAK